MSRKLIVTISLLVFLFSAYLLGTGSELLVKPLIKEPSLPLGNVLTWLGFIAFPLSIWFGLGSLYNPKTKTDRVFQFIAKVLVGLGISWAPISYLLAGNLSNEFSGAVQGFQGSARAGEIFWAFSYTLAAAPLVFLLAYMIFRLIRSISTRK